MMRIARCKVAVQLHRVPSPRGDSIPKESDRVLHTRPLFLCAEKAAPDRNLCEAHRTGARMAKRKGAGLGRRREKRAPDEGCRSGARKGGTHGTRFPRGEQIMREDYDTNPDAADQGECGICGKQGAGA